MVQLNTQVVNTVFNSSQTVYQNGGQFKIEVPQSSVSLPKPISYEFRVVEHVKNGQIVKVGLQYQVWEHDNYGLGIVMQPWIDVKRVQKDVDTGEVSDIIPT